MKTCFKLFNKMEKIILLAALVICGLISSCKSQQNSINTGVATEKFDTLKLIGIWELYDISGQNKVFEELFPDKKPTLAFDTAASFGGNTGCNSYRGKFTLQEHKINFDEDFIMTKMMCKGGGEAVFLESLKKVDSYRVNNDTTLTLLRGDKAILQFTKTYNSDAQKQ